MSPWATLWRAPLWLHFVWSQCCAASSLTCPRQLGMLTNPDSTVHYVPLLLSA